MSMVLAAKLKLYSVQCNITAAFVHGQVPEDEEIDVHQSRGKRSCPEIEAHLIQIEASAMIFFQIFY